MQLTSKFVVSCSYSRPFFHHSRTLLALPFSFGHPHGNTNMKKNWMQQKQQQMHSTVIINRMHGSNNVSHQHSKRCTRERKKKTGVALAPIFVTSMWNRMFHSNILHVISVIWVFVTLSLSLSVLFTPDASGWVCAAREIWYLKHFEHFSCVLCALI